MELFVIGLISFALFVAGAVLWKVLRIAHRANRSINHWLKS